MARELTKIHEEFLRGTVAERAQGNGRPRSHPRRNHPAGPGAAQSRFQTGASSTTAAPVKIADRVARIQAESGPQAHIDEKEALKRLARQLGQSKSELYRELQRERARLKTLK